MSLTHRDVCLKQHQRGAGAGQPGPGRLVPGVRGHDPHAAGGGERQRRRDPEGHPGPLQHHGGQHGAVRPR